MDSEKPKFDRPALIRRICEHAGITNRKEPKNQYMSKQELTRVALYLDNVAKILRDRENKD